MSVTQHEPPEDAAWWSRPLLRRLLVLSPVAVAAVVAVAGVDSVRRVSGARARVLHSTSMVEHADRLLGAMQDAETGQRGYLLTNEPAYMAPYRSGMAAAPREAALLDDSTRDNPEQQERVRSIRRHVGLKLDELAQTIRAHDGAGTAAALEVVRTGRGKVVMDSLRADVAAFRGAEQALLRRRMEALEGRTRFLALLIVLGGLTTAAVAWLTGMVTSRYAVRQARLAGDLAVQNAQLNEQALELELQNQQIMEQSEEMELQNQQLQEQAAELEAQGEELAAQVLELTSLARGLEAFSYSVSHDLRAPLGAVNGLARILQEDYAPLLGDEGRGHLSRIAANASQMGLLIDGLLAMSRVTHGELKPEPVELGELAESVVDQLRRGAPERRVEVRVAEGMRATVDRRLAMALVQNLLSNAWKFTRAADSALIEMDRLPPDAAVPCGVQAGPGQGLFVVRDNGAGFDPQGAGRLFTPFQRLEGAEGYEGTGIGLATVERIVQRHGGSVCGTGVPSRGAAFYFTLPVPDEGPQDSE